MKSLYQIGNINLYGHLEPGLEQDWKATGKTQTMVDSIQTMRPASRFLTDSRTFSVKVIAYNDEFRTQDMLYQQLINIAGQDTDIIAYDDLSTQVDFSRDPLSLLQYNAGELLWLHTRGQIREVKQQANGKQVQFDLKIETDAYWMPLNNILWSMLNSSGGHHHYLNEATFTAPYTANLLPMAQALTRILKQQPQMFHRTKVTNWGDMLDPTWYQTLIKRQPTLPTLGHVTDWSTDTAKIVSIFVDRDTWSVPPQTVYGFKALPATGTMTIAVERETQLWESETITTTIDLATVDTAVTDAGYTTVATDKLIVGDTHWMPGFVLRDNSKLTQIGDAVARDGGAWAGQLLPGSNRITITVPAGTEWFVGSINRRA